MQGFFRGDCVGVRCLFKLNDVNVWAGITRYFGAKQGIVIESYSTVHTMLCNVMLRKE